MEAANLKVIKGWQKSQSRASPAKEVPIAKSDEQMIPLPIPGRKGLRLDVDEILKRSLPKVSTPKLKVCKHNTSIAGWNNSHV